MSSSGPDPGGGRSSGVESPPSSTREPAAETGSRGKAGPEHQSLREDGSKSARRAGRGSQGVSCSTPVPTGKVSSRTSLRLGLIWYDISLTSERDVECRRLMRRLEGVGGSRGSHDGKWSGAVVKPRGKRRKQQGRKQKGWKRRDPTCSGGHHDSDTTADPHHGIDALFSQMPLFSEIAAESCRERGSFDAFECNPCCGGGGCRAGWQGLSLS